MATTTDNAATLLGKLLESFEVPAGKTPEAHRGFSGVTDVASWRTHNSACDLVRSIDHILIGMEAAGDDVDHFLESLPGWYAGVHFATTPWGSRPQGNASRPAASPTSISMLRALGTVLRAQGTLTINEDARRVLVDALEQARRLIEDDLDMFTPDVRHYLLALLYRAETVAREADTYGAERVREIALELGGAVYVQADVVEDHNPEKASRLRAVGSMLVGGFMGRFGEHAAEELTKAAADVAKSITGG